MNVYLILSTVLGLSASVLADDCMPWGPCINHWKTKTCFPNPQLTDSYDVGTSC
ncbi:hypothetical protein CERZMDRAFT_91316 [Cercospora zeae-maydis SCOH1-5]|uniref:CBM1 domain-containing protein n=1 Tax=Cercospora zeae-maydis SCOH1-5 TaxID=717836 RepID=A0A6A6F8T1_9PEZI|nr:hypothetical protein CERZMDRAFT_91316 [Cercospora zeae-maydis SCOH1-5]